MKKKNLIQCILCEGFIFHSNLMRHKRSKKCISIQVSNHLKNFWWNNQ